jgi:hypothetical protein
MIARPARTRCCSAGDALGTGDSGLPGGPGEGAEADTDDKSTL